MTKSFIENLPLCEASGCAVPERFVTPKQNVALALRRLPSISRDIYIRECTVSNLHVGLTGTVRNLIQKSMGWTYPFAFCFLQDEQG